MKECRSDSWPTDQNFFSINTKEAQNWSIYMEERCDKEFCVIPLFLTHMD